MFVFAERNLTRQKPPHIPWKAVAQAALGTEYELSLVFVGATKSRTLNRTYRGKDVPANVLSFPLSKTEGELFLNLELAKREHGALALFIHGLFHLKGMRHGGIMERSEKRLIQKFSGGIGKKRSSRN